jgi:two-component system cell cycle response regulator
MSLTVSVVVSGRQQLDEAWRLANAGLPARAYGLAMAAQEAAQGDDALEAESADCLADCCLKLARYELGIGFARIAAAIWQTRGDRARFARSYSLLAEFLADIGAPDAVVVAKTALAAAEETGEPWALAGATMRMGLVLFLAREPDQALPFSERSVAICREARLVFPVAKVNLAEALVLAGLRAMAAGDADRLVICVARAVTLSREALAQARQIGDGWLARLALNNIADYSLEVGDIEAAAAALAQVPETVGEPTMRCESIHLMVSAKMQVAQGAYETARATLEACLIGLREVDYPEVECTCLRVLADVLERLGLFAEGLAVHRRYHACFVRIASDGAQRLARVAAHESEARALRDAAGRAQSLAAQLMRSNSELARESERLLRVSLEDVLTGLPNRRRLDMALMDLSLHSGNFGVAMMDLDGFKQINDGYSHLVGDAVLREIGRILGATARRDDLAVRFGGEEFALIIRDANAGLAMRVAERLRAGVAAADWQAIAAGLAVTVSIGVALSDEAAGPEAVLKLADARLYEAKRAGRNRVVGFAGRNRGGGGRLGGGAFDAGGEGGDIGQDGGDVGGLEFFDQGAGDDGGVGMGGDDRGLGGCADAEADGNW